MTIPNVVGNIAGGAQAQRFAVANFERENAAAKAAAAKQLRDGILTGLLNTGIQTAIKFGEKAYDESTSGAREQERIDNDKSVQDFNMRVGKLNAGINMPSFDAASKVKQDAIGTSGYGMEQETAADRSSLAGAARELAKARESAPETGYGRMGRMGIDDSTSATASGVGPQRDVMPKPGPVNLGEGQRSMGAPSQPVLVQRDRTDEESLAAMTNEEDRAFQARLLEAKKQAAAAAVAAAAKAKQEREDALAKEAEANRLKSYQLIGGLQTATEQKLGPKGRPTNVPQFGVQPTIDPETGIVRPKFMEQPRVQVPVSGGGGGAAKPAFSGVLAEPVVLISAREGRKGDPTTGTPTKTWAARGEWATKAVQAPAKYALGPAEAGQVAAALRIIKANEADPTKAEVVANAVKVLDGARDASIQRMGPVFAQTGDVMGTSPTDTAQAAEKAKKDAESAALAKAKDEVAAAEAEKKRQLDLLGVQQEAINMARRDVEADFMGATKKTLYGVKFTADQAARARAGEPMPEDFPSPDAWNAVARDGSAIQKVRKAKEALLGSVPPRPVRGAPQQAAAPQAQAPKFTTPAEVRAAFKAGKITRADAAAAFKALGIDVED